MIVNALDFETSRFPDGSPYRASAQAVSWADTNNGFHYYTDPDFKVALKETLTTTDTLVLINGKFDLGWVKRLGVEIPDGIKVWDCQIAEYVLSGQTSTTPSMEELCAKYNIGGKNGGLEAYWEALLETKDIPPHVVEEYNIGDVARTLSIFQCQQNDERMTPALEKLIYLQGRDLLVLLEIEYNGIHYDKDASVALGDKIEIELEECKKQLQTLTEFPYFNSASGDHVSCLLYGGKVSVDIYEPTTKTYKSGPKKGQEYTQNSFQRCETHVYPGLFKPLPKTELKKKGYYQTGEPILRKLKCRTKEQKEVIQLLLSIADKEKLIGSFLHAIPKLIDANEWGNVVHPTYNQCVARTGRLSCSKPNAQQWDETTSRFWISEYD